MFVESNQSSQGGCRLVVFSDLVPDAIDILRRRALQAVAHHVQQDAPKRILARPEMHRVHDVWGEHFQTRARQFPRRMAIWPGLGMALVREECVAPLGLLTTVGPRSIGPVGATQAARGS